jgi:MFS family permease
VENLARRPWYAGVTRYQWLVLLIASLGWIFDIFEGQIFVASMEEAMKALTPTDTPKGTRDAYAAWSMAVFLLGGAVGGVFFGKLSDRIGRTTTMIITILVYSLFTCVTAFAQTWWQLAALRFLVALGVGGEWAVASAMVAEVFPERARAWSGGLFHASSVLGTYLATAAGVLVVNNPELGWRWAFAIGALPALLTLLIRWRLREPEKWVEARQAAALDQQRRTGRILDLFSHEHVRATLVGVSLAAVGLATFWGAHIYGKNVLSNHTRRTLLEVHKVPDSAPEAAKQEVYALHAKDIKNVDMLGMFLVTTGGGLGLVCFGPLCERIGRRGAFLFFHVGGLAAALALFQLLYSAQFWIICVALPVFGFLTLGMHAGYAIYFPELYPTRLRGTGAGFCFNVGRIIAAPILFGSGWALSGVDTVLFDRRIQFSAVPLPTTASALSLLFLLALLVLIFAPETKGRALPE